MNHDSINQLVEQLKTAEEKNNFKYQSFQYHGYDYYITKNHIGAWLAYIDITIHKEIQFDDCSYYNELSFHGGCTFSKMISNNTTNFLDLKGDHFLIGCDWCHGKMINHKNIQNFFGVENATIEEVKSNIEEVIDELQGFRLKKIISSG